MVADCLEAGAHGVGDETLLGAPGGRFGLGFQRGGSLLFGRPQGFPVAGVAAVHLVAEEPQQHPRTLRGSGQCLRCPFGDGGVGDELTLDDITGEVREFGGSRSGLPFRIPGAGFLGQGRGDLRGDREPGNRFGQLASGGVLLPPGKFFLDPGAGLGDQALKLPTLGLDLLRRAGGGTEIRDGRKTQGTQLTGDARQI